MLHNKLKSLSWHQLTSQHSTSWRTPSPPLLHWSTRIQHCPSLWKCTPQQQESWPHVTQEVQQYEQDCPTCTISRSTHHLPEGKLHPLPISHWSHLGVDFITDLPESDSLTCVLVAVDPFSKACRLIPMKGLPTTMETAESLFHHVFWKFGLPKDTVSDQGPQLEGLFQLLGMSVPVHTGPSLCRPFSPKKFIFCNLLTFKFVSYLT